MAIKAWNLLANGSGSIDWAGVELVFAHLGVADDSRMIHLLGTIKNHSKK